MTDLGISRRHFIGTSAVAVASLPAVSWGRLAGANDRLTIAVIGTGGMGTGHTRSLVERGERDNVTVTRMCDVYRRRLDNAMKIIDGSGTMEYREVIDDRDVDAVLIATPDHWHTRIAIEAMEAGKDVYVEKPLSLTIEQALACRDAVHRTGRTLQVGPQGTSEDKFWKAQRAIADGRIGRVTWSQGSYCRNSRGGQFNWHIDPDAGPSNARDAAGYVWWDRWLGHEYGLAPNIPWNADHFFRFRKYFAYNGGLATDLLYHKLAPLLLAIAGPNGEYPKRVVASGGRYLEKDERDIPDTFMMMVDYPSEHTVVLASVMTNDVGLPDMIRGQYGTMKFGSGITVDEQGAWWKEFRTANAGDFPWTMQRGDDGKESPDPKPGAATFDIHTSPRRDHMGNFLDAIRLGTTLHCNVDLGCATMVAIKMGVEAYRQDRVMHWDAARDSALSSFSRAAKEVLAGMPNQANNELVAGKVEQAVGILDELGVDAWLTFVRETTETGDPVLPLILGQPLTWQSALILTRRGDRIAVVGKYEDDAVRSTGAWNEVVTYVEGVSGPLVEVLGRLDPDTIAINYSENDVKADGLTVGMHRLLKRYLEPTPYAERLTSAERVVTALRSRKIPAEVDRMRTAIATTDAIFAEVAAYAEPGRSEWAISEFMHERARERGVGTAWEAAMCPIVTTGPDSMVGHGLPSSDLCVEPGRVFHLDFGVVEDDYCSDIQRCWYVPRAGETAAPAEIQRAFDTVVRAIQAAADALRPGVKGWEVDAAARSTLTDAGYPEYKHATGHHVGRAAHDGGGVLGPRWERYGSTPEYPAEPGHVVTLELGIDGAAGGSYIGLEEMVLVTETGIEWLSKPQTELTLLPG